VVRAFDGKRPLREALELSPLDDLSTLAVVQRLLGDGILRRGDAAPARKPSLQQWLGANAPVSQPPARKPAEPPPFVPSDDSPRVSLDAAELVREAEERAADALARHRPAPKPIDLVHFPPLRGVRRERLRREAEEARACIGRGDPVRLSHVVELPGWRGDGADALSGSLRRMSPAVGEAAKKFAPEAPVSRILTGDDALWDQQTAPSFKLTQAVAKQADAASEMPTLPPSLPPPIAPVAPQTPAPVATQPTPKLRAASPLRPRWPWYGAGAVVVAGGLAIFLWPQPVTDKKDAPWLEAAPARKAPEPAPAVAAASIVPQPSPDDYARALGEGEQLLRRGKHRQAIKEFKRAVQLNPGAVPAMLALGDAYLVADEPRNALRPLEKAAQLETRSGRAQLLLGTTYQSLGRNPDAVKAYQHYLELEPNGDFARDVRTILANLQR
jgi:hypothetical protein